MIKRDIQPRPSGAMLLPRSVLEHLKDASADELRALIYICAFDGCYDDTDACETCGITESQLNSAVSFWRGTKCCGWAIRRATYRSALRFRR